MSEHPRCAGLLHDGKRCRSVAVAGSEFCPHHAGLIEEHGADALKRGAHLPVRRKPIAQEPVMAEAIEATIGNGTVSVDPASVRPRLAAAAAESVDEIRRVLLETATGANRNLWATINCKHCGRAGRYEITVPDKQGQTRRPRLDRRGTAKGGSPPPERNRHRSGRQADSARRPIRQSSRAIRTDPARSRTVGSQVTRSARPVTVL